MKKNFSVNIQGHLFNIDEDAYELLEKFFKFLNNEFGKEHDIIVKDFKNRISQKLLEINDEKAKTIISVQDIEKILSEFGYPDSSQSELKARKRLFRNMETKQLGGVCAGLALRMNFQTKSLRIIFIILSLMFGFGVLLYASLWLLIPPAYGPIDRLYMIGEPVNVANVKKLYKEQFLQKGFSIQKNEIKISGQNIIKGLKISFFIKVFTGSLFMAISLFMLTGLIALFILNVDFYYFQGLQNFSLRTSLMVFWGKSWILLTTKWSFIIFVFIIFFGIFLTGFSLSTGIHFNLRRLYKSSRYIAVLCLIVFVVTSAWMYLQFLFLDKKETVYFFERKYSNTIYIDLFDNQSFPDSLQKHSNNYFCWSEHDSLVLGGIPELSLKCAENDSIFIVTHHRAYGGSAIGAAENNRNVHYEIASKNDTLYIMPYWTTYPSVWRGQNVRLTLFLPIGKSVFLSHEVMNWFFSSDAHEKKSYTGFLMTDNGLKEI